MRVTPKYNFPTANALEFYMLPMSVASKLYERLFMSSERITIH